MLIKQVSVFVENKPSKLADIVKTISDNGIDMYALSIADTTDFGILRLIVSDSDKAKAVLKEKGMVVKRTEVLGVTVEDKPGGLGRILDVLSQENIGIEYIYAFIGKSEKGASVVMKVDKTEAAIKLLSNAGIEMLTAEQLYK